jgi:hypothetical protein
MSNNIPLSQNLSAIVDDEDYEAVNQYKWHAARTGRSIYAYRHLVVDGKRIKESMHRMIMNAPDGLFVDHVNGNGLDCRRGNMRLATISQNNQNRRLDCRNKSGVSGIHFNKLSRRWRAFLSVNGVNMFLGSFLNFDDAVAARRAAMEKHHGEFASKIDTDEQQMEVSRLNVRTARPGIDRRIAKNNVSGCNGVSWNSKKGMWQASLYANGVRHHLGWHKELKPAIAARKAAEQQYYGQPDTN